MKINMTIDECIEYADEWSRGMTYHEDSQGWRVVCMLLAEEVRRLRGDKQPSATVRFYDMPDGTVETEVDMHEGYAGTNAQKKAARAASSKFDVDELAQFIRYMNGNNELGAGQLADLIHAWLQSQ